MPKTLTIKTGEKTLNKKVKSTIRLHCRRIKTVKKKHVPQCGYVTYFYDKNNVNIGNVSKENGQMTIRVKI